MINPIANASLLSHPLLALSNVIRVWVKLFMAQDFLRGETSHWVVFRPVQTYLCVMSGRALHLGYRSHCGLFPIKTLCSPSPANKKMHQHCTHRKCDPKWISWNCPRNIWTCFNPHWQCLYIWISLLSVPDWSVALCQKWTNLIDQATTLWRGIQVCPLFPIIISDCPGAVTRDIYELFAWLRTVPLGLEPVWTVAVAAMKKFFHRCHNSSGPWQLQSTV